MKLTRIVALVTALLFSSSMLMAADMPTSAPARPAKKHAVHGKTLAAKHHKLAHHKRHALHSSRHLTAGSKALAKSGTAKHRLAHHKKLASTHLAKRAHKSAEVAPSKTAPLAD